MNPNEVVSWQDPSTVTSPYLAYAFLIQQLMAQACHVFIGQVQVCTNPDNDVAPVGYVDVLPVVMQADGAMSTTPHGVVHQLPYLRLQGGGNAVICDPQPGDVGVCVCADRDISNAKANSVGLQSGNFPTGVAPGSARRFDMADGIYFGGLLNGTPLQYILFRAAGIHMKTPGELVIDASHVQINCALDTTGEVTAMGSHTLTQHTHTQGNDSHGDTEQPTNTPVG